MSAIREFSSSLLVDLLQEPVVLRPLGLFQLGQRPALIHDR
jgi:hypothetical protein